MSPKVTRGASAAAAQLRVLSGPPHPLRGSFREGGANPAQLPNSVVTASTMTIAARNGSSLVMRQNFAV